MAASTWRSFSRNVAGETRWCAGTSGMLFQGWKLNLEFNASAGIFLQLLIFWKTTGNSFLRYR
jgi:hypothetical protein